MKSNIVLIGMPGVGKSTIGVILAKVLGYEFVDTDLVIQKAEDRLLKEIIEEQGAEGFIALENRVLSSLEVSGAVIATGGSVVYGEDAMRHLSKTGTVVYLKQEMGELRSRLSNMKNRGVVFREGQSFEDLYEERCRLYERYAELTVDEAGRDIEQTLEELIRQLDNLK